MNGTACASTPMPTNAGLLGIASGIRETAPLTGAASVPAGTTH